MKSFFNIFIAFLILIGLGAWLLSGELVVSGNGADASHQKLYLSVLCDESRADSAAFEANRKSYEKAIASALCLSKQQALASENKEVDDDVQTADEEQSSSAFKVRAEYFTPQPHQQILSFKGRTEALAKISARSETVAVVKEVLVEKGQRVNAGDLLCQLDAGARDAALRQAQTAFNQADFEYNNGLTLQKNGHISDARLRQLKAARDSAAAAKENAEIELARIDIHSPSAGVISDPMAEQGDFLNIGGLCATVIDLNPMLAIAQVPEAYVGEIEIGTAAKVSLITGETIEGKIRYISPAADNATRTFRTEIEMDNTDFTLRDGVTANIDIQINSEMAFLLPATAVTLSEKGIIGIKRIDENNLVSFQPVELFSQTQEGVWAHLIDEIQSNQDRHSLPDRIAVITVGQDYVIENEKVNPQFLSSSQ